MTKVLGKKVKRYWVLRKKKLKKVLRKIGKKVEEKNKY
jgi:hypothetical protein